MIIYAGKFYIISNRLELAYSSILKQFESEAMFHQLKYKELYHGKRKKSII